MHIVLFDVNLKLLRVVVFLVNKHEKKTNCVNLNLFSICDAKD